MDNHRNDILLSIVTVTYNCVDSIEETIKSVLGQTYQNIEYIIIDGVSTDGTVDIIKKYKNQITQWISEPDNGIFDAMNKGITHCKGEFVGFMNAGDFYEKDACEKVVKHINSVTNASVYYGNTNVIISTFHNRYVYNVAAPLLVDKKIMIAPVFCHQSSFVKRDVFEKFGFFENVKVAGDWLHFMSLYTNNLQFAYLNETIANYQAIGASMTVNGFKESFKYKRKFGTFRTRDYITLFFFYVKDNYIFRNFFDPLLWQLRVIINASKYKKINW